MSLGIVGHPYGSLLHLQRHRTRLVLQRQARGRNSCRQALRTTSQRCQHHHPRHSRRTGASFHRFGSRDIGSGWFQQRVAAKPRQQIQEILPHWWFFPRQAQSPRAQACHRRARHPQRRRLWPLPCGNCRQRQCKRNRGRVQQGSQKRR